jgi:mRNA-degrading endonuclease RelE of RelBE toxin-antitoxin system
MHRTTEQFRQRYRRLPKDVRALADKSFQILRANPRHPSLQLKKVGKFWSARVGLAHRVLAVEDGSDRIWVWIGSHDEYDKIVNNR